MINKNIILAASILILMTVIIIFDRMRGQGYNVNLFKSENGWGYDISIGKKLFIHQPYMPTVNGQVAFAKRKSARKTADLVVKKIRNKQSPGISSGELRSIVGF
jgi:hypothetical protein